jgi:sec-independent protein translocase protein TatA
MGIGELAVILAIMVLLFGAKRLPELADGVGKAIKNFKRGMSHEDETDVTPPSKQVEGQSSAANLETPAARAADPKS